MVEVHTEFSGQQFAPGRCLKVEGTGDFPELTVIRARLHQKRLLLETDEVGDRDEAESLRNRWLLASPVESGEGRSGYGVHELTGLGVEDEDGRALGTVTAIHGSDANPVLEIEGPDGTLDFPAHRDLVVSVNLEEGVLRLRLPGGWKKLIRNPEESS